MFVLTTAAGFEPARSLSNALAGHRVNHSAKLPTFERFLLPYYNI